MIAMGSLATVPSSCSRAMVGSGPGWGSSCGMPSRHSPRGWRSARQRSAGTWIGRLRTCCGARRARRRSSGWMWSSRRCLPSWCRWRGCGARLRCSRRPWSGIPKVRSRRRTSRVVCRWMTRRGSWRCGAGRSPGSRVRAGWWRSARRLSGGRILGAFRRAPVAGDDQWPVVDWGLGRAVGGG